MSLHLSVPLEAFPTTTDTKAGLNSENYPKQSFTSGFATTWLHRLRLAVQLIIAWGVLGPKALNLRPQNPQVQFKKSHKGLRFLVLPMFWQDRFSMSHGETLFGFGTLQSGASSDALQRPARE